MTVQEFNEKYKEYLEEGHYGLDIGIPEVINYLDDVFKDLILIPGFKYSQIKEKWGSARFYTTLNSNRLSYSIERDITLLAKDYEYTQKLKSNESNN